MAPILSSAASATDSTPTVNGRVSGSADSFGRWWYPNHANPDQVQLADGGVICASWCCDGTDHRYADDPSEQVCRSVPYRLTPAMGGGRTGHARPAGCQCGTPLDCPEIPSADATLIAHGEQFPGEPPSIVLAIETAGSEHHVHLTLEESDKLTTILHTLGFRLEGAPD